MPASQSVAVIGSIRCMLVEVHALLTAMCPILCPASELVE